MKNGFSRRDFIQTLMTVIMLEPAVLKTQAASSSGLPTHVLGKTGDRVSIAIFSVGNWVILTQGRPFE